jgi:hypothetical protein
MGDSSKPHACGIGCGCTYPKPGERTASAPVPFNDVRILLTKATDMAERGAGDFVIDSKRSRSMVVVASGLKPAERRRLREWFCEVNRRKLRGQKVHIRG